MIYNIIPETFLRARWSDKIRKIKKTINLLHNNIIRILVFRIMITSLYKTRLGAQITITAISSLINNINNLRYGL